MSDGTILSEHAAEPVGPYPHARRVGDLLFLSGIGPRERGATTIPGVTQDATGAVVARDFEAQTRAVFANVRAVLAAAGADWSDIVDVTCFLTHMADDFATLNRLWAEAFPDPATRPTRTTVEVTSLPTPIDIELKVIARAPASEILQYDPERRWAAATQGRSARLPGGRDRHGPGHAGHRPRRHRGRRRSRSSRTSGPPWPGSGRTSATSSRSRCS